mmetsp:Transcript_80850/g.168729  ORF Transcript_80850/g.168729 Transcript_80850/m.168729 type:complete len:618 (+) Transcript_80850:65-1918(+)
MMYSKKTQPAAPSAPLGEPPSSPLECLHATHATHAATHASICRLLLRNLVHEGLSGSHETGDRSSVGQCRSNDESRVDDTGGKHVDVLPCLRIVAEGLVLGFQQLLHDNNTFLAGIGDDALDGHPQGLPHDVPANALVQVLALKGIELLRAIEQSSAATWDNALFDCSSGGIQGIVQPVLDFLDLNLGCTSDLDHGDTAGQLGKSLLQLVRLVLRGGAIDGVTDGLASLLDGRLLASSLHDHSLILGHGEGLASAQLGDLHVLELVTQLLAEELSAGEDGEILHDGLAAVTEARSLQSGNLQSSSQLVHDEDSQGLAINVLGHQDQGFLDPGSLLQDREDGLHTRDFLVVEQHQGVLHLDLLGLGVGDEVRRDVPSVDLHTLNDLQLVHQGLAVLNSDGAILSDLLESRGDQVANELIAVGSDGSNALDALRGLDHGGLRSEVLQDHLHSLIHTSLDVHGVHASGNGLASFSEDRSREDRGSGGAIAGNIVRLARDLLHELGANVDHGERLQVDGLRNCHTILGHLGGAEGLLDDHISALGSHGDRNGIGQPVATLQHEGSGLSAMADVLGGTEGSGGRRCEERLSASSPRGRKGRSSKGGVHLAGKEVGKSPTIKV